MANQIANSMSDEDKSAIENMDMDKMISHVTKNVFKMMGNNGSGDEINPMAMFPDLLKSMSINQQPQADVPPEITKPKNSQNLIYQKTRDICFDLNIDLEDFYTGKKKKLNIKRKRIVEVDGKQTVIEEKKKIIVPILPGMKDEQQIRIEKEADQRPGYEPGDIVITLIENEHPIFQRENDNLIIIKNINLYQLYDFSFEIEHLDGKKIQIIKEENDVLHLNESIRKISNLGMPVYKKNNTFGDLFVRFNLVIPKSLSSEQLIKFKDIFKNDQLTLDNVITQSDKVFKLENVSDTDLEDIYSSSESDESESISSDSSCSSISSVSSSSSVSLKKVSPKRK